MMTRLISVESEQIISEIKDMSKFQGWTLLDLKIYEQEPLTRSDGLTTPAQRNVVY